MQETNDRTIGKRMKESFSDKSSGRGKEKVESASR